MLVVRVLSVLCECCKCLAELGLNCSHAQQQKLQFVVRSRSFETFCTVSRYKGKVIPLQARCGQEGG